MPRRRFDGAIRLLAYLHDKSQASLTQIRNETGMKYETIARAVEVLKEIGFVEEEKPDKPPYPRIIRLTEKGRRAAELAKQLLELAGEA